MRGIIQTGEMSRRVDLLYRDETGDLAHSFNLMTGELEKASRSIKDFALKAVVARKQVQKIRTIFQRYVPRHVLDQYIASPESMLVGREAPRGGAVLRYAQLHHHLRDAAARGGGGDR